MLIERQLKMESIIANIEADASLDEASKKQQVSTMVCSLLINEMIKMFRNSSFQYCCLLV